MDPRIAEYLSGPLALRPGALSSIAAREPRAERVGAMQDEVEPFARFGPSAAHLSVTGPMCYGIGDWAWYFGLCDTEALCESLHAVADDETIETLLLEIDSPGGDVAGMADLVAACTAVKESGTRLVAIAHEAAYSAAYWLASQADEVYLTETAAVGSIGAFTVLYDTSAMFDKMGSRPILVASTGLKGVNVPGVGITDAQIAAEGEPIAEIHRQFVEAVADGRQVSTEIVQGWAESADAVGEQAVNRGMADGIKNFRQLVDELANNNTETHMSASTQTKTKIPAKSAAALARANGKARAAEGDDDETTPEEEIEALRAKVEELEDENEQLKKSMEEEDDKDEEGDSSAEGDDGEDDDEEDGGGGGTPAASASITAIKQAIAEDDGTVSDAAKAFACDACELGLSVKQATAMWEREGAGRGSDGVRHAAAGTKPVGRSRGGDRSGTSAKARWESAIVEEQKLNSCDRKTAVLAVSKSRPDLRNAYLAEVNTD